MEKINFKKNFPELKKSPEKKVIIPAELAATALILLNISIILLDFYSHPHQGLADLERRKILESLIGNLAKHIGNYGFSSCLATAAVFAKYGFDSIISFKKKINYKFLMRLIALISVINITIESFSPNKQFAGDVISGTAGAIGGALSATLLISRIKAKRKERISKVKIEDALH